MLYLTILAFNAVPMAITLTAGAAGGYFAGKNIWKSFSKAEADEDIVDIPVEDVSDITEEEVIS